MEGLTNPYYSDIKQILYPLYRYMDKCSLAGMWHLQRESRFFGIKELIIRLGGIINKISLKLDCIEYENKENVKKILLEKEELLIELFFQYEEIEKNYTEDDKFFRENLFEFYKKKYKNCSYFSFSKMKFLMYTMNDIQAQLRKKFFQYCDKYCQIRNNFFEINNYIIKIKKLFNI